MTDTDHRPPARTGPLAGLNRQVFALGPVSLFTDIAGEMIVPIRIIFLVLYLGTPVPLAGLIEGSAESLSSLLKVLSGRLADRVAERKPLLVAGYGLSAVAKPLLGLVAAWPAALGLIAADRVGKGVRGSPQDATLAGWLWATFRPGTTFAVGAAIAAVATGLLLGCTPRLRRATALPAPV